MGGTARPRPLPLRLRHLLPRGRRRARSTPSTSSSSGREPDDYRFEEPDWWVSQIRELAAFYLRPQFGDGPIDYRNYRTSLQLDGGKKGDFLQETDTISRLVYGFASAFLLTGEDRSSKRPRRAPSTCATTCASSITDENLVYWYHGIQVTGRREQKLFTSEFGDDFDAIPMYEQIYALAGPTQTFRVTGDPRILTDIENTVRLFDRFFHGPRAAAATSRTSTRSRSTRAPSRSGRTGPARTGTRSATTPRRT